MFNLVNSAIITCEMIIKCIRDIRVSPNTLINFQERILYYINRIDPKNNERLYEFFVSTLNIISDLLYTL